MSEVSTALSEITPDVRDAVAEFRETSRYATVAFAAVTLIAITALLLATVALLGDNR